MSQFKIWGHRGASAVMPENTLPAFEEAVRMHADGIELDIQLTKDGEIVVCHDETLERTSDGTGFLKDYTLAELKEMDFSKTHPEYSPVRIPTMKEVIDLIRPTQLTINIELKTGVFDYEGIEEKIVELVRAEGMQDRVIYSSFNHYSILKIQQLDPDAKTAFLYMDGPIDFASYAKKYNVSAIHPWFVNLRMPGLIEDTVRAGMDINVWTVNTQMEIAFSMRDGVNALITNNPEQTREIVRRESEYREYMQYVNAEIRPWLKKYAEDGWFTAPDGLRLHYVRAVHPDEKATIVMIHGFCEFFGKYHETAYRFWQAGYSVYFLELRGYGKSDREMPFEDQRVYVSSFDSYVMDLESFMKKVVLRQEHVRKLMLFSHSMGGAVGALFLEKNPDIFSCAVFSSPMFMVNYGKVPDAAIGAMALTLKVIDLNMHYAPGQKGFTGEYDFAHSSCLSEPRYRYQFEQRCSDKDYQTWGGTTGWVNAAREAVHKLQKDAAKVRTPVLIASAGKDTMVRNEGQTEFCRKAARTVMITYPDSKHELFNGPQETIDKYYQDILVYFDTFAARPAMKTVRASAAVIEQYGKVFAVQRGSGEFKDGWEFPGGKIEAGETPEEALVREIREELDVEIAVESYIDTIVTRYPEFLLVLHCYKASLAEGEIRLLEAEDSGWFAKEELDGIGWLKADRMLVDEMLYRGEENEE